MPSLWKNQTFALLFTAQAISLAGSGVTTVALAIFVHQLAGPGAATIVLGQALMLRIVAFLIFSQPAGILADRLNRKSLMIASDLARFALMAFFPFIHTVRQVYAAVFFVNALTAFFTPAFESTLPEVAGPELYVKALGYSRIAMDIEAVGGPAIAAILVGSFGVQQVFWFDAATYLVSAALVWRARVPQTIVRKSHASTRTALQQLTHGSRVLLREPAIRQALLMNMAGALAGACAIVVTINYVRDVLRHSEAVFTLTMAGVGLGSSLAAVGLGRITSGIERANNSEKSSDTLHGRRHQWASKSILAGGLAASASLLPGLCIRQWSCSDASGF